MLAANTKKTVSLLAVYLPAFILLVSAIFLELSDYNRTLFDFLNHELSPIASTFWQSMTALGDAWVAIVVLCSLITIKPTLLKPSLVAIVLAVFVTHGLKAGFQIPRPAAVLPSDAMFVVGELLQAHNSFPSGHTLTAFTVAGIVAASFRVPLLTSALFALASLVGMSRIMVGAHWPADILLGGSLGWMIAYFSIWFVSKIDKHPTEKKLGIISRVILLLPSVLMFTHDTHYPAGNSLMYGIASLSVLWMLYQFRRHFAE